MDKANDDTRMGIRARLGRRAGWRQNGQVSSKRRARRMHGYGRWRRVYVIRRLVGVNGEARRSALISILMPLLFASAFAKAEGFPSRPDHVTSRVQEEAIDNKGLAAAESVGARILIPLALDIIKDFEGWSPEPYNDASIYCTIGFGHLIAKKSCADSVTELTQYVHPLSQNNGLRMLEVDTKLARMAVQRLVHQPLSDEQFGALSSFVFNVGGDNLANSTLLKYLNNGEFYPGAAKQFSRWITRYWRAS